MQQFTTLLLSFICLCYSFSANAQLKISKDHISCTYGLKNKANEWVVKPVFLNIEPIVQRIGIIIYKTQSLDSRFGLLNTEGTEILPPIYEALHSISASPYVIVFKEGVLWGAINEEGTKLSPKYSRIKRDYNCLLLREPNHTTYVDLFFKQIFSLQNIYIEPFGHHSLSIAYKRINNKIVYGAIDKKGTTIIAFQYDKINRCKKERKLVLIKKNQETIVCDNQYNILHTYPPNLSNIDYCFGCDNKRPITFYEDNKSGLMDCKGGILIPPFYDYISIRRYHFILQKNNYKGVADTTYKIIVPIQYRDIYFEDKLNAYVAQTDKKKYGLHNLQGKQILAPTYDKITPIKCRNTKSNVKLSAYSVQTDKKKHGIYSLQGKQILAPIYDRISFFSNLYSNYFTVHLKNKMGLYDLKEKKFLAPVEYKEIQALEKENLILLIKENQIFIYDLSQGKIIPTRTKDLDSRTTILTTNIHSMWDEKSYYILHKHQGVFLPHVKQGNACKIGEFFILNNSCFEIKNGAYVLNKAFKINYRISFGKYSVTLENHKEGIFDFVQNRFIITPAQELKTYSWKQNRVLVKRTFFTLIDTLGKPILTDRFESALNLTHISYPRLSDHKVGKFNPKTLQWIIPPIYKEIFVFYNTDIHLVKTTTNKYGVASGVQDTLLLDTIYTSIAKNLELNISRFQELTQILVHDNGTPILYDNNGLYTSNTDSIKKFIYNGLEKNNWLNYSGTSKNIPLEQLKNKAIETPFIKTLLKICNSNFHPTLENKAIHYNQQYFWTPTIEMMNQHSFVFKITHTTIIYPDDPYVSYEYQYEWLNYTFLKGHFQRVDIHDIFSNNNILEKELLEAIQNSDYLDLDCSNIENRRIQIGEAFELSEEGVHLHLIQKNIQNSTTIYTFLVPWENLLKYPETRVFAQQFLDPLVLESILNTFKESQTNAVK